MTERRNFLKGFGLLSAVIAGAAAPEVFAKTKTPAPLVVENKPQVDPKIITQIESINPSTLSVTQTYGEIEPPKPPPSFTPSGSYFMVTDTGSSWSNPGLILSHDGNVNIGLNQKKFVPGTEKQVNVKFVPGPDGELYLNINGQWKKVLTV